MTARGPAGLLGAQRQYVFDQYCCYEEANNVVAAADGAMSERIPLLLYLATYTSQTMTSSDARSQELSVTRNAARYFSLRRSTRRPEDFASA